MTVLSSISHPFFSVTDSFITDSLTQNTLPSEISPITVCYACYVNRSSEHSLYFLALTNHLNYLLVVFMFICITFITLIPFFKLAKQKQFSPDASKIQDKNEKKEKSLKKLKKKCHLYRRTNQLWRSKQEPPLPTHTCFYKGE